MKQEFTGKDLDAAIAAACSALQISRKDLQYEVLSTGASGIFGIVGRRDAKIRVKQSSSQAAEADMEGIKSIVDEAFGEKPSSRQKSSKAKKAKKQPAGKKAAPQKPEPPIEKKQEKDVQNPPENHQPEHGQDTHSKEPTFARKPPVDVPQSAIDLGLEAVQKMADLITDETVVTADTQEDVLTLKIEGGNSGILIGRKGQTLDAMQFLVDKMINRQEEDRVRVRMDIQGYMETRKANLRHLAQKMASKAKKTGRPATINQMSAQDRRIIHMALKNDFQIRTQSMGDGYYRRLVIFPKKKYKGNKNFEK